jgi:hypothetical protein
MACADDARDRAKAKETATNLIILSSHFQMREITLGAQARAQLSTR